LSSVAVAAVLGGAAPSFAHAPVTVEESTDSGAYVRVGVADNPGAAAWVTPDGTVCAGFSYQIPQCADTGIGDVVAPPGQ
jgi:hypothetical protein